MARSAFVMELKPGNEAIYSQKHDEIWPEMVETLHGFGIHNHARYVCSRDSSPDPTSNYQHDSARAPPPPGHRRDQPCRRRSGASIATPLQTGCNPSGVKRGLFPRISTGAS